MFFKKGRTRNGASVCPTKMLALHDMVSGAAGAQAPAHETAHGLDDDLDDAEVVHHRHESGEEDDGGQHHEGKLEAKTCPARFRPWEEQGAVRQVTEEKEGAFIGQFEERGDAIGNIPEGRPAVDPGRPELPDSQHQEASKPPTARGLELQLEGNRHDQRQQRQEISGHPPRRQVIRGSDPQHRSHQADSKGRWQGHVRVSLQGVQHHQQNEDRHGDKGLPAVLKHHIGENQLKPNTPHHNPPAHRLAIIGE